MSELSSKFDQRYQDVLLAHCLRENDFLEDTHEHLSPELFGADQAQRVIRLILDHYSKYKCAIGELVYTILADFHSQGFISQDACASIVAYLDILFGLKLTNKQYILEQFDNFIRQQKFAANVIPAAAAMKMGRFEDAEALVKEAFLFKQKRREDLGGAYDLDPDERIKRRNKQNDRKFWTLIPELDARVDGLEGGQLGIWQSQATSAGKSAALVHLARAFALQSKRVLIITLEMSKESYEDRLDQCIAGLVKQDLKDRDRIISRLLKITRSKGSIWIKQFPGKLTTVDQMRDFTTKLKNVHNFSPDVILLDYINEVKSSTIEADNLYGTGADVASHVRGWAVEDNIPIWSGAQSGRGAMEAPIAGLGHMGKSIAIAEVADLIISINRTPEQKKQGRTTLAVLKNRGGPVDFTVEFKTDFSTMQFYVPEDNP